MREEVRKVLEKEVVSTKQAAEMLAVSESLIKKYVKLGGLSKIVVSKVSLYDIQDIKMLMMTKDA